MTSEWDDAADDKTASEHRVECGRVGEDMTIAVYGIKNCSTVKKARDWLDEQGVAYVFHDYKIEGADPALLKAWCGEFGWETILNRSGTTFRKVPEEDRQNLDEAKAIKLMLAQPSMIKRPVVDLGKRRLIGFKADLYAETFK
jgi:arsenate reductase (glutaredoxin)